MKQFRIFFKKEWRENVRNYKILWIPLVFILFAILEPVTQYFLPQILDSVGNLPDGAVIELPVPTPEEIMVAIIGQYHLIGSLVLILAYMGAVAGERRSGTAALLYVRPLSYPAYFLSKWAAANIVALIALWLGLLAGYYYTALFFAQVNFTDFLQFGAAYSLWIVFVVTIVLAASASMPNAGIAAALSFALIIFTQLIDSVLGAYWTWSPFKIPNYAAEWLWSSPDGGDFWGTAAVVLALIALAAAAGIWTSKKNSAKAKV